MAAKTETDLPLARASARFVRIAIHRSSQSQPCIDEFEVYAPGGKVNLGLASSCRMDWSTPEKEMDCHFRRDIGISLCPELADIPRGTLEMPGLEDERVEEMAVAYSLTWYGMMIWPEARQKATGRMLGYYPWWGAWTAAALCEALIAEGYTLNVN